MAATVYPLCHYPIYGIVWSWWNKVQPIDAAGPAATIATHYFPPPLPILGFPHPLKSPLKSWLSFISKGSEPWYPYYSHARIAALGHSQSQPDKGTPKVTHAYHLYSPHISPWVHFNGSSTTSLISVNHPTRMILTACWSLDPKNQKRSGSSHVYKHNKTLVVSLVESALSLGTKACILSEYRVEMGSTMPTPD